MRQQEQIRPEQFLYANPVFRREDLEALLVKRNSNNPTKTADAHIQRWTKAKTIERVKSGVYVSTRLGTVDPLLIASRLSSDAVLGFYSALEIHGLAHSIFNTKYYITRGRSKPFSFGRYHYVPTVSRKELLSKRYESLGVETVYRLELAVKVTTISRTVVDVLDRIDLGGGVEEVWSSLQALKAIRLPEVMEYASVLKRRVVFSRLGFFLERFADELNISQDFLIALERKKSKSICYFHRSQSGFLSKRWNIIVPNFMRKGNFEGSP